MYIDQLSIFIENRPGRLAEITHLIGSAGIDIKALSIADTTDFGILRIITSDTRRTEALLREHNITVSVTTVLAVSVPHKPGGLAAVLDLLAANQIDVEYMYGFVAPDNEGAFIAMRIENFEKAGDLLAAHGYHGISAS